METSFTLQERGYIRKIGRRIIASTDRIIPVIFFDSKRREEEKFTEMARSKMPAELKIESCGDDLLINDIEFDILMKYRVYLHVNIGILWFHLQGEGFFPMRYLQDKHGRPRRILFKGTGLRNSPDQVYWFALYRAGRDIVGDIELADYSLDNRQWTPIAA